MSEMFFMRDTYINIDPIFSEKSLKALTHVFNALIYLLPLILFLYYRYFKKNDGFEIITSIENIQQLEKKRYYNNILKGVGLAVVSIIFAVRIYWFYTPSNSEISLAIIINYLRNNKVLDEKIYEVIKQYKPDNIGNFVS
mgnify:CR=1 FL=1|jgi:uncharacterized membrane protein